MSRRYWKRPADAKRGDRFRAGKRIWSAKEDALLRKLYADTQTVVIAKQLRRTACSTFQRAYNLGLKKSAAFLSSEASGRLMRKDHRGRAFQFKKGHVPANKGLRRPGYGPGRMKETQFKKGELAGAAQAKWVLVGTVVVDADGYHKVKVSDHRDRPSRFNWEFVHVRTWTRAHGPVRKGCAIVFKNGNRSDIRLDNLECITRRQLMKRNTVHNLPKPIARAVQMLGALNRQIRKRDQHP